MKFSLYDRSKEGSNSMSDYDLQFFVQVLQKYFIGKLEKPESGAGKMASG